MPSFRIRGERKITRMGYKIRMWAVTALLLQHRISSRDLSLEQSGVLRTEMIFKLPSGLLLRMMGPLHLHELHRLVARLALRRLEDTDWVLWIRKIITQLDVTQVHCLLWLLEALLQLRNMKHIVHHRQTLWKLKPKGERSSSLKDTKGADKPRSKLAFDAKAMSSPQRRHSQICQVTDLECHTSMLLVIVSLLP